MKQRCLNYSMNSFSSQLKYQWEFESRNTDKMILGLSKTGVLNCRRFCPAPQPTEQLAKSADIFWLSSLEG